MGEDKRLKKIPEKYQTKVRDKITDLIDFITKERLKQKLSQDEFSEMLNLSLKTYQSYEYRDRKPSMETLLLMFIVLRYDLKPKRNK